MANRPTIKFHGTYTPRKSTLGAAGFDLICKEKEVFIAPGGVSAVSTGLKTAIPEGYWLAILSRSGLASRGIIVANAPGVIDSDYRGDIKVLLANIGSESGIIHQGDRIAQAVLMKDYDPIWSDVEPDELGATGRGSGGLGSTGA